MPSGAARDDPGSLHGALRAAGRISERPDRDTRRDHLVHPADRRLRGRPGHRAERCAVVLFTWPVGIGMGLAGAVVPVAVKERFATRPAGPTGVYTMGIQSGSALSAAIAVPLAATGRLTRAAAPLRRVERRS